MWLRLREGKLAARPVEIRTWALKVLGRTTNQTPQHHQFKTQETVDANDLSAQRRWHLQFISHLWIPISRSPSLAFMEVLFEGCLLPQELRDSLDPYLKTRHDALKIRRTLSIYLTSLIELPEGLSHLSFPLAASNRAVNVKPVSPPLTGARKEYLKALQANVVARKQYISTVEKVSHGNDSKSGFSNHSHLGVTRAAGDVLHLQIYLELLREREKLEKLQIHHHYLDRIMTKEAAQPHYLDCEDVRDELGPPPLRDQENSRVASELDDLTERLEKSVLQAKSKLAREKKLLDELRTRLGLSGENSATDQTMEGSKVLALQRTKDELIEWIEQQLAKSAGHDGPEALQDSRDAPSDMKESRSQKLDQIKQQYANYIQVRKSFLATSFPAGAPLAVIPQEPIAPADQHSRNQVPDRYSAVLPTVIEHLVRLTDLKSSLTTLKSHHADSMTEGKSAMLHVLNRLSDESHLIPAHPLPVARGEQRIGAAFLSSSTGDRRDLEISMHAKAWSFASDAARTATEEHVIEKSRAAEGTLCAAQESATRLKGVLGEKGKAIKDDGIEEDGDESDIWAAEAKGRSQGQERRFQGPFSGLRGNI
jgi:hypothetical protein